MKPTYQEGIQMDALLLAARRVLAEAEQLDTGHTVRITLYNEENRRQVLVVPARVATYAARAMGQPALVREAGKVVFFSQGVATAWLPTTGGWAALLRVVIARKVAEMRRTKRQRAQLLAKLKKGGLAA